MMLAGDWCAKAHWITCMCIHDFWGEDGEVRKLTTLCNIGKKKEAAKGRHLDEKERAVCQCNFQGDTHSGSI